jgi:hypothetical protein
MMRKLTFIDLAGTRGSQFYAGSTSNSSSRFFFGKGHLIYPTTIRVRKSFDSFKKRLGEPRA